MLRLIDRLKQASYTAVRNNLVCSDQDFHSQNSLSQAMITSVMSSENYDSLEHALARLLIDVRDTSVLTLSDLLIRVCYSLWITSVLFELRLRALGLGCIKHYKYRCKNCKFRSNAPPLLIDSTVVCPSCGSALTLNVL